MLGITDTPLSLFLLRLRRNSVVVLGGQSALDFNFHPGNKKDCFIISYYLLFSQSNSYMCMYAKL